MWGLNIDVELDEKWIKVWSATQFSRHKLLFSTSYFVVTHLFAPHSSVTIYICPLNGLRTPLKKTKYTTFNIQMTVTRFIVAHILPKLNHTTSILLKLMKETEKRRSRLEREIEGSERTSSYLGLLSCNLLERRQERYKPKLQTDSFWLWGEWNISYLLAKWQNVLIVHCTVSALQRGTTGLKSKKIPVVFLLPFFAICFSLIFPHRQKHTSPAAICWLVSCFTNDQMKTLACSSTQQIFQSWICLI